jgi:hypothetical protein
MKFSASTKNALEIHKSDVKPEKNAFLIERKKEGNFEEKQLSFFLWSLSFLLR